MFTSIAPDGSKAEIGGGTGASGLCSFSKDFICLARNEDGNKLQVLGGNTVAVDADGGNSNTAIYAFKAETNSFLVVAYGAGKAELPFSSLFAFNLLYIDPTKFQNTFAAGITSTYTTGWMPGHIKGAFLSDTDDADLVGDG